jgi:hypothetical protein
MQQCEIALGIDLKCIVHASVVNVMAEGSQKSAVVGGGAKIRPRSNAHKSSRQHL